MLQSLADPLGLELLKAVGVPALSVIGTIWLYKKLIEPKVNGRTNEELQALTAAVAMGFKEMLQAQDTNLTRAFDQLRRDLTTTIEHQAERSRDDQRNALTTLLLEQELGKLRGGDK